MRVSANLITALPTSPRAAPIAWHGAWLPHVCALLRALLRREPVMRPRQRSVSDPHTACGPHLMYCKNKVFKRMTGMRGQFSARLSFCGARNRLKGSHQGRVKDSELWVLTIWSSRRHGEPLGRIRKYRRLLHVEFCVVAKARRGICGGISIAKNCELASMWIRYPLARAICDTNFERPRVVVIDDEH